MDDIQFKGGINIALKVPKVKYDETVRFYRDVLKMDVVERPINNPTISKTHKVTFGGNILWLDCVDNYSRSEIWLELNTADVEKATLHLESNGIDTCDELEQIPPTMHWITDPAGTVLLVAPNRESSE